jgi:peptidoglycan/LPS O-acetylase OafA/YrhL
MYLSDCLSSRANNFGLIRHIAALVVIYGHCYPLSNALKKNSHTPDPFSYAVFEYLGFSVSLAGQMVSVFFFLSGLLIAKSAASHTWWVFWKARLLRIYPALWGNIIFCAVVGTLCTSIAWDDFFFDVDMWNFIWMNGTLWMAVDGFPYLFEQNPWQAINGSLWTLPHELRMYILCFVVGSFGALHRPLYFNALLFLLVVVYLSTGKTWLLMGDNAIRLPLYFMFGMASYVNARWLRVHGAILFGLCVIAAIGYVVLPRVAYDLLFACALSYAVLYAAYRYYLQRFDTARFGDFSYGIYLYGFPVQQVWVWWYGGIISPEWLCVLTLLTVIPLAVMSWFMIEKPALALRYKTNNKGELHAV